MFGLTLPNTIFWHCLFIGPDGDCAPGDQVTCGQCGQRFPLADLSAFVQHKMAAACARPEEETRRARPGEGTRRARSKDETRRARPEEETRRARPEEEAQSGARREEEARTAARASLSSPRVSGTDEVVALHKDEQEEEEDRRRGGGGSPDLEDSSTAGLYHTDRA